jgi:hypothetical protein
MAYVGRGAVEYVTLQSQAEEASKRFHQRIHVPVLTDIAVDWGTLAVAEVYPRHIPDLFSNTPIMIHGRLTGPAEGTIVLRGHTGSGAFVRRIHVQAGPTAEPHEALASLWARAKVKGLMMQDYASFQSGNVPEQRRQEITATGVTYRLMTPFTSFVAVEEMTVTVAGQPTTIAVPVDIPDGVSYTGIFGRATAADHPSAPWSLRSTSAAPSASRTKLYAQPMVVHERAGSADATVRQEADPNRRDKLAEVLRGLEQKVMQEGTAGTLTVGQLRVINYTIDVIIYLRDTSVATLQALRQLGFMPSGESKVIRLVIGAIDVRRLPELAQLESVIRIIPTVS